MPPAVVDAINSHRAALLAREAAAMQAQAQAWLRVEQTLQAQIDALALELANTGTATFGQLQRSRRYRALMEQTRAELRQYSGYMEQRIVSGQQDMITLALQHSQQAVNAVATEAGVIVPFDRLPVSAVNNMVGLAGDGSPLRAVLADAARVGPDALAQELVNGIALGRNPVAVARRAMRLGLGQSFTRMQTIARTEMLRTYRETTLQSYRSSNVVKAYRRLSARDSRTCPGCLFADGKIYALGESFDQHPNCRCALVPVLNNVPMTQFETGREWFAKQPEEVQRDMLGPSRYAAWKDGKISFDDMISRTSDKTWGGSITTKSVRSLGIPKVAPVRTPRSPLAPNALSTPRRAASKAPASTVSTETTRLQQAWVHGSNNRGGIAMKEAVRSEFGVRNGIVYNPHGYEIPADEIVAARAAVREMYDKTQAHFKELGITEVKLYRGIKSEVNVHGVLESWTTDLKTAKKFNGHDVIEKTISVDNILLSHNGPGWKNGRYGQQYEYVVMPQRRLP